MTSGGSVIAVRNTSFIIMQLFSSDDTIFLKQFNFFWPRKSLYFGMKLYYDFSQFLNWLSRKKIVNKLSWYHPKLTYKINVQKDMYKFQLGLKTYRWHNWCNWGCTWMGIHSMGLCWFGSFWVWFTFLGQFFQFLLIFGNCSLS